MPQLNARLLVSREKKVKLISFPYNYGMLTFPNSTRFRGVPWNVCEPGPSPTFPGTFIRTFQERF